MAIAACPRNRGFTGIFLFILLASGLILCAHALKHGEDAQIVRQCAADPQNLLSQWSDPNTQCTHNIVKLPGHQREAGDQIRTTKDGQDLEVTSFIPRCGVLCKIEEWLSGKGAVKVWPK